MTRKHDTDLLKAILLAELDPNKLPASITNNSSHKIRGGRGGSGLSSFLPRVVAQKPPKEEAGHATTISDLPQILILEIGKELDMDTRVNLMFLNKVLMETYKADKISEHDKKVRLSNYMKGMVNLMEQMFLRKQDKYRVVLEFSKDDHKVVLYTREVDIMDTYYAICVAVTNDEEFETKLKDITYQKEDDLKEYILYSEYPNKKSVKLHIRQTLQLLFDSGYKMVTADIKHMKLIDAVKSKAGYCKPKKVFDEFNTYYMKYGSCAKSDETTVGGVKRVVHTGVRGGKYIIVNGKKKYLNK